MEAGRKIICLKHWAAYNSKAIQRPFGTWILWGKSSLDPPALGCLLWKLHHTSRFHCIPVRFSYTSSFWNAERTEMSSGGRENLTAWEWNWIFLNTAASLELETCLALLTSQFSTCSFLLLSEFEKEETRFNRCVWNSQMGWSNAPLIVMNSKWNLWNEMNSKWKKGGGS